MLNYMRSILRSILGCFIAGVLAVLPLVITIVIVVWVAGFVERIIGPKTALGSGLRELGLHFASDTVIAYVIGWVLVLAIVFVLGVLVKLGAGLFMERITNSLIRRIPIIGSVHQTAEQLVDMLKKKDSEELKGMSVVFCVFGKENGAGILALMPSPERFHIGERDYHVVLIPTAPVPFGGALLFVPAEAVHPSDMSVDGLMSIYVSMGVTVPQFLEADKGTPDKGEPEQ